MVRVERYNPKWAVAWDDLVARSKNGVFLFLRSYLEYHADRFVDHSLLFFEEDQLLAILPANERDGTLCSHGGLTFGGIVSDERMRTPLMLQVFDRLKAYLRSAGISRLLYKVVPHIYHRIPAEEDLYALFVHEARLVRRDVSTAIRLAERPAASSLRKRKAKRARTSGLVVQASRDFAGYLAIVEANLLQKYGVRPTHTAAEMELLAGLFPQHIKLYGAYWSSALVGGVIVYENRQVAHAQYIAATDEGKELGALDLVTEVLLEETYAGVPYFDFGISTEKSGRYLNVGLIDNKESYGARAVAYDQYEVEVGR